MTGHCHDILTIEDIVVRVVVRRLLTLSSERGFESLLRQVKQVLNVPDVRSNGIYHLK